MATTPQQIVTEAQAQVQTWFQKHERLLLVLMVTLAMVFLGNKWLSKQAANDQAKAVAAQQVLTQQQAQDKQLAEQVQQSTAQYQALITTLSQENAQLAAAMQNRTVILQQQQTADKTLPLPDLGNRWTTLAQLQPGDLTATDSGITVTPQAARSTVVQLEQVPVLQQNLKDETTVADNRQTELTKANDLIGGLNQQVTGLNTTVTEEGKACKAEVTSLKASARKSKFDWFLKGLAVGGSVVTALVLHL
jgi:multidrug efflux pump subunit AcrA (membrane-fusion protein)